MAGNPISDPEFPKKTVDFIDRVVGAIRDRTTKPLVMAARGLVFGLLAAFLGILIICAGLQYQKKRQKLESWLLEMLPHGWLEIRPANRTLTK